MPQRCHICGAENEVGRYTEPTCFNCENPLELTESPQKLQEDRKHAPLSRWEKVSDILFRITFFLSIILSARGKLPADFSLITSLLSIGVLLILQARRDLIKGVSTLRSGGAIRRASGQNSFESWIRFLYFLGGLFFLLGIARLAYELVS